MVGDVAQLGERCNRTAEVVGSNPIISTKYFLSRGTRKMNNKANLWVALALGFSIASGAVLAQQATDVPT